MKKGRTKSRITVNSGEELAAGAKRCLDINRIRDLAKELMGLPDGAPMPDYSAFTIGDRFAILLRLIPLDQWEELIGKSKNHIRTYEAGKDIPLTAVAALAAETEVPLDWIVSGRAMDRLAPIVYVTPEQPSADGEDVAIQKLAFKAAAGSGAIMLDDQALHVRFPRAILAHAGIAPHNARLMEAAGESMKTTINDGDLMLVDVSATATQIVEGKIYVFSVGEDAFVKRLRRLGDDIMMISDNREMFPETAVPKESPFRVYGRVKWAGRIL